MVIMDYIFYRLYMGYKNRKDRHPAPRFYASTYFMVTLYAFTIPSSFLLEYITNNRALSVECSGLIAFIIIPVFTIKRYNRRRIAILLRRYKTTIYNKLIPTWIFFLLIPLALLWAFIISGLIIKYVLNQQIIFAPLQ